MRICVRICSIVLNFNRSKIEKIRKHSVRGPAKAFRQFGQTDGRQSRRKSASFIIICCEMHFK